MYNLIFTLLTITGLLYFQPCSSQEKPDSAAVSIQILEERSYYQNGDTLYWVVTNNTEAMIDYYIGFECFLEGTWELLLVDIYNPDKLRTTVRSLQPHEKEEFKFSIGNLLNTTVFPPTQGRLIVRYSPTGEQNLQSAFSGTFRISKE